MSCARCDGRGSFNVYTVDPGKPRRPRIISIPCPSCQCSLEIAQQLDALQVAKASLEARVAELTALAFVPGLRRCAKCGCQLMTTIVNVPDASFTPDGSPKPCPNGCGPTWPVTERAAGNEAIDREDRRRLEVYAHEQFEAIVAEKLGAAWLAADKFVHVDDVKEALEWLEGGTP